MVPSEVLIFLFKLLNLSGLLFNLCLSPLHFYAQTLLAGVIISMCDAVSQGFDHTT
jgi:hypothetical protein